VATDKWAQRLLTRRDGDSAALRARNARTWWPTATASSTEPAELSAVDLQPDPRLAQLAPSSEEPMDQLGASWRTTSVADGARTPGAVRTCLITVARLASVGVIEIRECTKDDVGLLEQRMPTGGHDAHAHHFAGQQAGGYTYLTAWEDGRAVGACLVHWNGAFAPEVVRAHPDATEISNVHVHHEARGRGIGTGLIRAAEQLVAVRGGDLVVVGVSEDNPRAAALYTRLGYRDAGLRWTARYRYRDAQGIEREVIESNRTLVKQVGVS
jgi:ribosomal protein S18 acetylase RimI-like enzyme